MTRPTPNRPAIERAREAAADLVEREGRMSPSYVEAIRRGCYDEHIDVQAFLTAITEAEQRGMERAAMIAHCHSDDRPRRDNMDWNDGYQDGCTGAAAAIRTAKDAENG